MSISGVFTTIINGVFTLLQIVLGAAIIAVPLLTMRKPPDQTKKYLMLLSIGAAGILILSSATSFITQIITLSSIGAALSPMNILATLLSLILSLFGIIFALAFPLLIHMLKKTIKPLVFLLVLPAIQAIIVIVNSATGFTSTIPSSTGAIVPGILCSLLLIAALVLFTVWYLAFSSNRTFTLVVMIALPVVFVLCFILSTVGSAQLAASIGMSAGVLNMLNFRSMIFSNPMCMLLLLLFAMTIREFGIQKSAPPAPYNPGPYYPQN